MKKSIGLWQLMGFAVTSLVGTILHFLYELLGESVWIAPFSGVNESTWEHMKLLFFPMLLFAVLQSFFFRDVPQFWCVKLRGTIVGLFLIPVLFYTYNGAIGPSPDFLNISFFFISAAVAYVYEARLLRKEETACPFPRLAFTALCLLGLLFVWFTFSPPEIPLFEDPISGSFGI